MTFIVNAFILPGEDQGEKWNCESGYMISASTSSRKEVLALCNKSMHDFLNEPNEEPPLQ